MILHNDEEYNIYDFLQFIEENIALEAEAIQSYFKMIDMFKKTYFEDDNKGEIAENFVDDILNEIISEEIKHREKLGQLSSELSSIIAEK